MKKQGLFNIPDYTLIICLYNSEINVSKANLEQFMNLFHSLQSTTKVSKGIVISRREISSLLKKEIHQPIHVQTIDEIKHNLINFDSYLKQLVDEYENGDIAKPGNPPLNKCFVELDAEIIRPDTSNKRQPIGEIVSEWLEKKNQSFIVVFGGYGTGKTSFSYKTAYDLACKRFSFPEQIGLRIPIIFPLRRFPKISYTDIEALIISHLKQSCKVENPDFEAFKVMNRAGLFVLIFHGFDEMAASADLDVVFNNFSEIFRFASFPNAKVIITSRPEVFLTEEEEDEVLDKNESFPAEDSKFMRIELCPFSKEQIELYLQKRIPLIKNAYKREMDWKFYRDKINGIIGLKYLAERPVLLEMTVTALPKLIEEGGLVSRPRLYETYLKGELNRQIRDKERDFLIKGRDIRFLLIKSVAIFLYQEKRLEITKENIKDVLQKKLLEYDHFNLDAYLRDFIACSFMVREGNLFRFSHRSFIDYIVAKQLKEEIINKDPQLIGSHDLTSEALDFLIELKPDKDDDWFSILWYWIKTYKLKTYNIYSVQNKTPMIKKNAAIILHHMGEPTIGLYIDNIAPNTELEKNIVNNASKVLFEEIKNDKPYFFRDLKFSLNILNHLKTIKLESEDFWQNTLWKWIRSTSNQDKETAKNIGGNAITLLHILGESFAKVDLKNTILFDADLPNAKFTKACLQNCNLEEVNLEHADLTEAILIEANVATSNLNYTNSTNVNFEKANLMNSQLQNANFTNANFTNANLKSVSFKYTSLGNACFQGANLEYVEIWQTDHYIGKTQERLEGPELIRHLKSSHLYKGVNLNFIKHSEPYEHDDHGAADD